MKFKLQIRFDVQSSQGSRAKQSKKNKNRYFGRAKGSVLLHRCCLSIFGPGSSFNEEEIIVDRGL